SRPLSQGADRGGEDLHVALAGAVQRELHQDLWQATALVLGGRPDVQEAALLHDADRGDPRAGGPHRGRFAARPPWRLHHASWPRRIRRSARSWSIESRMSSAPRWDFFGRAACHAAMGSAKPSRSRSFSMLVTSMLRECTATQ